MENENRSDLRKNTYVCKEDLDNDAVIWEGITVYTGKYCPVTYPKISPNYAVPYVWNMSVCFIGCDE